MLTNYMRGARDFSLQANTAQQLSAARELIGGTRAATLREIVYMMVSDAVCEPASECAETLKCDAERLSEHRRKLSACIHAAAALMVTANGVPALRDDKGKRVRAR